MKGIDTEESLSGLGEASGASQVTTPESAFRELADKLGRYLAQEQIADIERAFRFGAEAHRTQRRQSGEPYILHPIEVASILADLNVDHASIIAAILHDVVEDTETTLAAVEAAFGSSVAQLVDGLTKIAKIQFRSNQEKMAENFRKMVLFMAKDVRVILIKLADRLHNMRTLGCLAPAKRERIAQETLDIYAPLANRLGINGIKSELEDLCLRVLKSDVYMELKRKVAAKKTERQALIDEVKRILEDELRKYGFVDAEVYGRPKHFYSMYKKMVSRHLAFEDIHDLIAFRIIVGTIKDCYEALGVVHAMWKPMPGRFKDYIAMPKANMYQSLHTTVVRPSGEPAEIQIRTREMHKVCEYGVASHWVYKDHGDGSSAAGNADLKKFAWVRQIMEWQSTLADPAEFLEAVKIDLFEDEIFVFTPKGDVIQLPLNSTALDFAFSVHTDLGLRTVGAKINGRLVPIKKTLKSGDIIEVITSKNQQPSKDWLNFVTTSKARSKIRSYLHSEQRERSRRLGQEVLEQALGKRQMSIESVTANGDAELLVKAARLSSFDNVLSAVGYGRIDAEILIDRVFPGPKGDESLVSPSSGPQSPTQPVHRLPRPSAKDSGGGIRVSGIDNVLINFGGCCNPLPGEELVGYITRGVGVTVHRSDCQRALNLDPARKVDVSWSSGEAPKAGTYRAFIKVITHDKTGVLADITTEISKLGASIQRAEIRVLTNMTGVLNFELSLSTHTQLQDIMGKIEAHPSVISVRRRGARS